MAGAPPALLEALDDAPLTKTHWRIWALSGMGVFLDGFDLFIIGVAMPLIIRDFNPASWEQGLIAAAAAIGAVIGAFTLGRVTDHMGRKAIYVVDLGIFVVFAIASALSWDVWSLIIFRFCLGIGIGADYPISASYVAEILPKRSRGQLLIGAFSFQAIGAIFGALVGLLILDVYPEVGAWRWMLAVGAIPAIITTIVRLSVPESPRWLLAKGETERASVVVTELCGREFTVEELTVTEATSDPGPSGYKALFSPRFRRRTTLACVPWFLMDIATYGIGLFTPTILAAIAFSGDNTFIAQDIASTEGTAVLDVFLVVGFGFAILLVDRVGRIPLQLVGFLGMAFGLFLLGFTGSQVENGGNDNLILVFVGFVLFNVMMNAGPNSTTFTLPAELYPSSIRATGHGLAAACGKTGAVVGLFIFPILKDDIGVGPTVWIISGLCIVGLLVTYFFRIETLGRSLDDLAQGDEVEIKEVSVTQVAVQAPTA